jgi:hypothetical protein
MEQFAFLDRIMVMNRILRLIIVVPLSFAVVLIMIGMLSAARGASPSDRTSPAPTATPAKDVTKAVQQKLSVFQGRIDPAALDAAWPYLNSPECNIREVARLAVEAQPFDTWKQRALEEKKPWASLEALRALIEACPRAEAAELSPHLCEQIATLGIEQMSEAQQLIALQLTRAIFNRLGPVSAEERTRMIDLWSHFPEPLTGRTKAEVTRLIAFIEKAPTR